ncbi:hypothetical protein ACFLVG_02130 [Chloroflexota bacterium]
MTVWKFKGCPRCSGDVFIESDLNGWYEQCLQCSWRHELKNLATFEKHPELVGGTRAKK